MKSKVYTVKDLTKQARLMTRDIKKNFKYNKQLKVLDLAIEITPSGLARLIVPFKLSKKGTVQSVNVVL
jgi:hypothetical protein